MALIIAGILSAVFLSSTMFGDYPLVLDEHGSYWLLDSDLPSSLYHRSLDYAAIPPLSAWTEQISMALPVRPEWAFRLPSMVFFCLGVLTVGLIGRRFGDPVTGGLAAILLAWNPLALNEIRIARCYGLVVFEASLLLWITLAWWQRPRDARVALAFAIVTSILAWTHYLAVLFACTCGAALVMIPRRRLAATPRRRRTPLGLIAVVVSITTLACLPLIPSLTRLRHWSPLMELQSVPPNLLDVAGPVWFAGLPALLIAAMALRRPELYAENSFELHLRPLLVISGCISLSSLVVFLAFGIWGPHSLASNPRYQVAFTVAVSLFLAATARQLTGRLRRPTSGALFAGAVSVVGTWLVVGASPLAPTRLTTVAASEWKQAAQIATEHSEDNDLILVQSGLVESAIVPYLFSDQLFMEYVACRMGRFYLPDRRTRLALPFYWTGHTEMESFYSNEFGRVREAGGVVWVACATDTASTQNSLNGARKLLARSGWKCSDAKVFGTMVLEQYQFGGEPRRSESLGDARVQKLQGE